MLINGTLMPRQSHKHFINITLNSQLKIACVRLFTILFKDKK